jgi:hypothetical protein
LARKSEFQRLVVCIEQHQECIVLIVSPLSITPSVRTKVLFHSSSSISIPPGLNHMISLISEPRIFRPWKNFGRRKIGCSRRKWINLAVNRCNRSACSSQAQFVQEIWLSWQ